MSSRNFVPNGNYRVGAFEAIVPNGLKGVWLFNRGVRRSRHNLATGGTDADVVGKPSTQGAFVRFKGQRSFFQTRIPDSAELTFIVAGKSSDSMIDAAHSPMFISNYGAGSEIGFLPSPNSGASLYSNADTSAITMAASRYSDGNDEAINTFGTDIAASLSSWQLIAGRVRTDRTQRNNLTANTTTITNYANRARVLGAGDFRIGSSYHGSWTGEVDIAFVAMYDRFLSDDELSLMGRQVRSALDAIGIMV